jgi:hypothetical protein
MKFWKPDGRHHVDPQVHVDSEPQNVTLFRNRVFAYIINNGLHNGLW